MNVSKAKGPVLPRPGPRRTTMVFSDGDHSRSWGWWCVVCTPPNAMPDEIVGSGAVMLRESARKCAKAHERSRHPRPELPSPTAFRESERISA